MRGGAAWSPEHWVRLTSGDCGIPPHVTGDSSLRWNPRLVLRSVTRPRRGADSSARRPVTLAILILAVLSGFALGVGTMIAFVSRFGGDIIQKTLDRGMDEIRAQAKATRG